GLDDPEPVSAAALRVARRGAAPGFSERAAQRAASGSSERAAQRAASGSSERAAPGVRSIAIPRGAERRGPRCCAQSPSPLPPLTTDEERPSRENPEGDRHEGARGRERTESEQRGPVVARIVA